MDAAHNSFQQLSLTFSSASSISFSRIKSHHWSNFLSLRSIDLSHRFPPWNHISTPFPYQWFPTVDLCWAFFWPPISRFAGCGMWKLKSTFHNYLSTILFLQQQFFTIDLLQALPWPSLSILRDVGCEMSIVRFFLSTTFFPQTSFHIVDLFLAKQNLVVRSSGSWDARCGMQVHKILNITSAILFSQASFHTLLPCLKSLLAGLVLAVRYSRLQDVESHFSIFDFSNFVSALSWTVDFLADLSLTVWYWSFVEVFIFCLYFVGFLLTIGSGVGSMPN